MSKNAKKCGVAAIIGAPNAGKSTLTNAFVGAAVSAVSRKTNTTRGPVLGAITRGATQVPQHRIKSHVFFAGHAPHADQLIT